MNRQSKRVLTTLGLMFLVVPGLSTAFAEFKTAGPPEGTSAWLQWTVTLVMAGACAAILFKNAKRSHMD